MVTPKPKKIWQDSKYQLEENLYTTDLQKIQVGCVRFFRVPIFRDKCHFIMNPIISTSLVALSLMGMYGDPSRVINRFGIRE
jgi:hypothetical protein